jgi:hypothetical protein
VPLRDLCCWELGEKAEPRKLFNYATWWDVVVSNQKNAITKYLAFGPSGHPGEGAGPGILLGQKATQQLTTLLAFGVEVVHKEQG